MTTIAFDDGRVVFRDGKVGTEQECCCQQPCNCASPGWAPFVPSDTERGMIWVEFASCIGSGATATVDAPQAASVCDYEAQSGPITGITLTNGGSGYAVLGRVEPTVTATVVGGSGGTLSVTLEEQSEYLGETDDGPCMEAPFWRVASVSVTSPGSGYSDAEPVTFEESVGDTEVHEAKAYAYVATDEPVNETVEITSNAGAGATLVPVWSEIGTTPRVGSPGCAPPPRKLYELSGLTVSSGGSGYAVDDIISVDIASSSDGIPILFALAVVDAVDGGGAITATRVIDPGEYAGSLTDELASVVVESCVTNGRGKYYREDASVPPYVADVTVTVNQDSVGGISGGGGAVVTATVEDDTTSPDFGKIVALTLDDGGAGYLDSPAACGSLGTLYITTAFESLEIPARFTGIFGVTGPGDTGWIGTLCSSNANTNCFEAGVGATGSLAYGGLYAPGAVCRCDGSIYLDMAITFECGSCYEGSDGLLANFYRGRLACLKFEMDESGCPVGDAEVLGSWSVGERALATGIGDGGCEGYDLEECPCDDTCDVEVIPQISFMP